MEQKILDCTLRDGGLVNRFYFTDDFVRGLYQANLQAGIDYMEFGYKASEALFDRREFGKWKFCREEDLRAVVGDNKTSMKISVMADVGRTDYSKDILEKKDSVIDMVRIAAYAEQMGEAMEMVSCCKERGYETSVNIMAISNNTDEEIDRALETVSKSRADAVYVVDSYGSFYPEQIKALTKRYIRLAGNGRKVGIHAHNNQQLAFANVIVQNSKWMTLDAKGYLAFYNYDTTEDGYYFTKGKCIHITWQKTTDYGPTRYFDDAGNEIQLNEGKTYIAVAQKERKVVYS